MKGQAKQFCYDGSENFQNSTTLGGALSFRALSAIRATSRHKPAVLGAHQLKVDVKIESHIQFHGAC